MSGKQKFQIRYGLGGGFGGCGDWEDSDAQTLEDAGTDAYYRACEEYDSYAGMHGLRDIEQIMEEDEVDEDEAEEIYNEERESWVDYESRVVDDNDQDT